MPIQTFTAARCRFTLNGVVVAFGKEVTVSEEWSWDPQKFLDNLETVDHAPIDYNCSMNAAETLVVGKTLEALGLAPRKGQTPQDHLRNLLSIEDLIAQLEDNVSDTVIGRVFGVKLASKNIGIAAPGSVARNLSFVARRFIEAAEAA